MIVEEIQKILMDDEKLSTVLSSSNVFAFTIPDYASPMNSDGGIVVLIDTLDPPTPATFYDGDYVHEDHLIQIDVSGSSIRQVKKVSDRIQDKIWHEYGWGMVGGVDQYDKEIEIHRAARRYRGVYKKLRSDL